MNLEPIPGPTKNNDTRIVGLSGLGLLVVGATGWGLGFATLGPIAVAVGVFLGLKAVFSRPRVASLADMRLQEELQERENLRRISKIRYLENVEKWGERTGDQLDAITARMKQFKTLLPEKFNPGELAFDRYQNAVNESYQAMIGNLEIVSSCLTSVNAIEVKAPTDPKSERTLIREKQLATVGELLELNEKAITELDRVAAALGELRTRSNQAQPSLDSSLAELRDLAARAKKYSLPQ